MKIYLDVTRLATRIYRGNPTGIDRVEYAYAKHLLQSPDTVCVFTAPVFSGAINRSRALDILSRVEGAWRLDASLDADQNYSALRAWLDSPIALHAERPFRVRGGNRWGALLRNADFFPVRDMLRAETRLERSVSRNGAEPAMFFHCSHAQLDKPDMFNWLKSAGMRSAFFVHDAIPIEFPEFFPAGSFEQHAVRLATVSALAGLVIVNSRDTRRSRGRAFEGAQSPRARTSRCCRWPSARPSRRSSACRRSGPKRLTSSMSATSSRAKTCCFCSRCGAVWSSGAAPTRRGW